MQQHYQFTTSLLFVFSGACPHSVELDDELCCISITGQAAGLVTDSVPYFVEILQPMIAAKKVIFYKSTGLRQLFLTVSCDLPSEPSTAHLIVIVSLQLWMQRSEPSSFKGAVPSQNS